MILFATIAIGALLSQDSSERVDLQNDPLPHGAVARLGSTRLRHGDSVHSLAFSYDGRFLVSFSDGGGGGCDCSVRVWEVWTGTQLRKITIAELKEARTFQFAISPKGDLVAFGGSGDPGGLIEIWDLRTGAKQRELKGHTLLIAWLAFSPDGTRLASASHDGTVRLWNPATGAPLAMFDSRERPDDRWFPTGGVFSPDGRVVYSPMVTGGIRSWDLPNLRERPMVQCSRKFDRLALSPDGTLGVIGGEGLRFFHPGKELSLDPPPDQRRREEPQITGIAWSPDGKTLAAAWMDRVVLLDLPEQKERTSLEFFGTSIYALAFSPDSRILAGGGSDGAIRLWDAGTGRRLPLASGSEDTIWSLAVAPDGKMAATGTYRGLLRRWELPTGQPLPGAGYGKGASGLTFSPDGKTLAAASFDRLSLLDPATGQARLQVKTDISSIISMAFSPNGQRLAARDQGGLIRLWDVATGDVVLRLEPAPRVINYNWYTIAYAPDGKSIVTAPTGAPATLWDAATGDLVRAMSTVPDTITGLSFSPDGKLLAAGSTKGTIHLYDPSTGAEVRVLKGNEYKVCKVAFAPDGKILGSVGSDRLVHLWDPATGKELAARSGHLGILTALEFSGDGKLLVTAGYDGTGLVWDVAEALTEPRPRQDVPMSIEQAWDVLASPRAEPARRAAQTLTADPGSALTLLKKRLLARERAEQFKRLVSKLNDDDVAARRAATEDLAAFGDEAEAELEATLAGADGELRILISEVLGQARGPVPSSPVVIRRLRAIHLLEEMGTPEARKALESIQPVLPSERERKEAKAALERLAARSK